MRGFSYWSHAVTRRLSLLFEPKFPFCLTGWWPFHAHQQCSFLAQCAAQWNASGDEYVSALPTSSGLNSPGVVVKGGAERERGKKLRDFVQYWLYWPCLVTASIRIDYSHASVRALGVAIRTSYHSLTVSGIVVHCVLCILEVSR